MLAKSFNVFNFSKNKKIRGASLPLEMAADEDAVILYGALFGSKVPTVTIA